VSVITSEEWLSHKGSVGRTVPPYSPLVVDNDGLPTSSGVDGRLYFVDASRRGIRYRNDPEKTAAAHMVPGTFTLGDVGHVDQEGYLYVTGRTTDMVLSGGVNIYPAECERVLADHPSVEDVILFGVPDAEMGERLVGLVQIGNSVATVKDLLLFCREHIAGYKVPKNLVAVSEIPRSPMGKPDRQLLSAAYLERSAPFHRSDILPDS
jgi:acyl-CoA synthetase (AMP-forming)/AMP-acid ligase II